MSVLACGSLSIRRSPVRLKRESRHDAGGNVKEAQAMKQSLLEAAARSTASAVPGRPRRAAWSVTLLAGIGVMASALASLATWLLLTDPLAASKAVSSGQLDALLDILATALLDILRILIAS
jgi:hypothetical protein